MLKLLCDCDRLNDEWGYQRKSEYKVNVVQPNGLRPWHKMASSCLLSSLVYNETNVWFIY